MVFNDVFSVSFKLPEVSSQLGLISARGDIVGRVYLFALRRLLARQPCILHFSTRIVHIQGGIVEFALYLLPSLRRSFISHVRKESLCY